MSVHNTSIPSVQAIDEITAALNGMPAFLAGSAVAADTYGLPHAWSDIDVFAPTDQVLVACIQQLLDKGYVLDDRFKRVWARWLRFGFKKWHTNSIRLLSPGGVETNLVYKLTDGHPTTSLSQVLESFDFGLLGMGYELEDGTFRDARPYLFPQVFTKGPFGFHQPPLPMMPNKRTNWRAGFISQYNGMREFGRYAKYHGYGFDMSLVKDDLATGYNEAAIYHAQHFDPEKQKLGAIYQTIAMLIEDDNIDQLLVASKEIDYKDSLDQIMEALE